MSAEEKKVEITESEFRAMQMQIRGARIDPFEAIALIRDEARRVVREIAARFEALP